MSAVKFVIYFLSGARYRPNGVKCAGGRSLCMGTAGVSENRGKGLHVSPRKKQTVVTEGRGIKSGNVLSVLQQRKPSYQHNLCLQYHALQITVQVCHYSSFRAMFLEQTRSNYSRPQTPDCVVRSHTPDCVGSPPLYLFSIYLSHSSVVQRRNNMKSLERNSLRCLSCVLTSCLIENNLFVIIRET